MDADTVLYGQTRHRPGELDGRIILPESLKAKRELLLPHPDNPFTIGDIVHKVRQEGAAPNTALVPAGIVSGTPQPDTCDISWEDGSYSPISNQLIVSSSIYSPRAQRKLSEVLRYLYNPDNPFNAGDIVQIERGRVGVIIYLVNAHLCMIGTQSGEDKQVFIESLELLEAAPCPYSDERLRILIRAGA